MEAPPVCPVTDWGVPVYSNEIGVWPIQLPYYPLDPTLFGLTDAIFVIEDTGYMKRSVGGLMSMGFELEERQTDESVSQISVCYDDCGM